jgi:hypothetical protein
LHRLTKNLEFYFPKYLAVPQLKYIFKIAGKRI